MKSKKGLIIITAVVLLIALGVGLSFAAWDKENDSKDLSVTVGDRISVTISETQDNANVKLLPADSKILEADSVNNTALKLIGSFVPTLSYVDSSNAVETIKIKYAIDNVYANPLNIVNGISQDRGTKYADIFDIFLTADSQDTAVVDGVVQNQIPVDTELSSGTTYYVYMAFKKDITSSTDANIAKLVTDAVNVRMYCNLVVYSDIVSAPIV